jgi:xanthine dehydrogenase accessory factor
VGQDLTGYRIMAELAAALDQGRAVVVATVIDTEHSVPRRSGAKMLIFSDRSTSGSIGGGEMESRVIEEAMAALADRRSRLLEYALVDPGVGDPGVCGGQVKIYMEAYMPTPTVLVIGCGHIGRAVIHLADWLGFRVVAYDDRPEHLSDLPGADVVVGGSIADLLLAAPVTSETHVVVVTRNMAVDLEILPNLLATEARSFGVMGSRRRWEATRHTLAERGVSPEALDRVIAPIGLELAAETPEEIAVSILSQIISIRHA